MVLRPKLIQDSFHPHSLGARVMLSAFIVLFIFMIVIVAILDHYNKNSLVEKYSKQLELQVYNLAAITEYEKGELEIASFFNDLRLNKKENDLIAMVFTNQDELIWDSFSAKKTRFETIVTGQIGKPYLFVTDALNGDSFLLQSLKAIPGSPKTESEVDHLTFVMGLNTATYRSEVLTYRRLLLLGSLIVISALLILQGIILFFGFQSLARIALDLKAIGQGEKNKLDGRYPKEIQSVSQAVNQLIANERSQKDKYQKSLADLAHSLKTPLAVLQSHSENLKNKSLFSEQIERIDQIITYQLQRASHSGKALGNDPVNINKVVNEISSALKKVYQDKGVKFTLDIMDNSQFYGDKNDLMELLGNLLDNAFRLCKNQVLIKTKFSLQKNRYALELSIEDDGTGIAEQDKSYILQRGARADTLNPGQGIGLAVVADIVNSYNGDISIEESSMGGASFKLRFKQEFI